MKTDNAHVICRHLIPMHKSLMRGMAMQDPLLDRLLQTHHAHGICLAAVIDLTWDLILIHVSFRSHSTLISFPMCCVYAWSCVFHMESGELLKAILNQALWTRFPSLAMLKHAATLAPLLILSRFPLLSSRNLPLPSL